MEPDGAMLTELGRLIESGIVTPVIDRVFPMDQAAAAYDALADQVIQSEKLW